MNNDNIKKKTEELTNKIKETEEELKKIRKTCKHSEFKIKDINFGVAPSNLKKVCKICEKIIGFPSKEDLKNNGYSS